MSKKNGKILVIVPCYNEEENIGAVVRRLEESPYDYLVVDDGSRDRSLEILKEMGSNYLHLDNNLGIGGAVQAGYRYAWERGYEIAVQFDGDGQHRAEQIGRLTAPLEAGQADLVIGSRFLTREGGFRSSFSRRLGIRALSGMLHLLTGRQLRDVTSGFRAANRRVIRRFAETYPCEYPEPVTDFELCALGYTVLEVPVTMNPREHGASSINGLKSAYYMINVMLQFLLIKWFGRGERRA